MGRSIEAVLCYGILVGEDLPWIDDGPGDPDEWWRKQNGYKPMFDLSELRRSFGVDADPVRIAAYFAEQRAWDTLHPMPFLLLNDGDCDEECWIVVVPGTVTRADWGSPVRLEPHSLDTSIPSEKLAAWRDFVDKYEITGNEGWFMFSYYDD